MAESRELETKQLTFEDCLKPGVLSGLKIVIVPQFLPLGREEDLIEVPIKFKVSEISKPKIYGLVPIVSNDEDFESLSDQYPLAQCEAHTCLLILPKVKLDPIPPALIEWILENNKIVIVAPLQLVRECQFIQQKYPDPILGKIVCPDDSVFKPAVLNENEKKDSKNKGKLEKPHRNSFVKSRVTQMDEFTSRIAVFESVILQKNPDQIANSTEKRVELPLQSVVQIEPTSFNSFFRYGCNLLFLLIRSMLRAISHWVTGICNRQLSPDNNVALKTSDIKEEVQNGNLQKSYDDAKKKNKKYPPRITTSRLLTHSNPQSPLSEPMVFHLSPDNSPGINSSSTKQIPQASMAEESLDLKAPTNYCYVSQNSIAIRQPQRGSDSSRLEDKDDKPPQPYIDNEKITIFPLSVNSSSSPKYTRSSRSKVSHRPRQLSEQNITPYSSP